MSIGDPSKIHKGRSGDLKKVSRGLILIFYSFVGFKVHYAARASIADVGKSLLLQE